MLAALAPALPCAAEAQTVPPPAAEARSGQPLGEALEQFGRRTGFDVVFQESRVNGLRAGAVDADASPQRALEQMLKGTGLVARFTRPDAIILEPERAAAAPDMTLDKLEVRAPGVAGRNRSAYQWYGQRLLEESLVLLRGTAGLATRPYDLFVYLWVDSDGKVTDLRVYGGDGETREADLAAAVLKSLAVRMPPPLDMPQPVGLRIASH